MPVSLSKAVDIVNKGLPGAKIQAVVTYHNLFIFRVIRNEPFEEEMDPFFSVDQRTGELRDFSILTDGDGSQVVELFNQAQST